MIQECSMILILPSPVYGRVQAVLMDHNKHPPVRQHALLVPLLIYRHINVSLTALTNTGEIPIPISV